MAQKKITPKQLDLLVGQSKWSANLALSGSTSQTVTSFFAGSISGGTDTSVGVIASAPNNKVYLRVAGTGHQLKDDTDGTSIFARLTEVSGAWTLSYFVLINGTEVPYDSTDHSLVGSNINFRWCEIVQAANYKPTSVVNAGGGIDQHDASSVSSHHHINDSLAVTTNGQTTLVLSQTPKDPSDVILIVNTATYNQPESFTVDGVNITWVATGSVGGFDLEVSDKVTAVYAYAG